MLSLFTSHKKKKCAIFLYCFVLLCCLLLDVMNEAQCMHDNSTITRVLYYSFFFPVLIKKKGTKMRNGETGKEKHLQHYSTAPAPMRLPLLVGMSLTLVLVHDTCILQSSTPPYPNNKILNQNICESLGIR